AFRGLGALRARRGRPPLHGLRRVERSRYLLEAQPRGPPGPRFLDMTTLENRPNIALLVVDVQNGVVEGAHERDAVVANVGALVEKARREGVPVVWVQHCDDHLERGTDNWRIVPELSPDEAEPLVEKSYGDSFEDTTLETVLSGLGVGRLVVV